MKNEKLLKRNSELREALFQARLEEKLTGKSSKETSQIVNEYKENLFLLNS